MHYVIVLMLQQQHSMNINVCMFLHCYVACTETITCYTAVHIVYAYMELQLMQHLCIINFIQLNINK